VFLTASNVRMFVRASQVLERFTIEHMVNQYADLYSDLLTEEAN
jgi:hypothetical protein